MRLDSKYIEGLKIGDQNDIELFFHDLQKLKLERIAFLYLPKGVAISEEI